MSFTVCEIWDQLQRTCPRKLWPATTTQNCLTLVGFANESPRQANYMGAPWFGHNFWCVLAGGHFDVFGLARESEAPAVGVISRRRPKQWSEACWVKIGWNRCLVSSRLLSTTEFNSASLNLNTQLWVRASVQACSWSPSMQNSESLVGDTQWDGVEEGDRLKNTVNRHDGITDQGGFKKPGLVSCVNAKKMRQFYMSSFTFIPRKLGLSLVMNKRRTLLFLWWISPS